MKDMTRMRTIQKRLKEGYHYPTVQDYRFTEKMVVHLPDDMRQQAGGEGMPASVEFRYASPLDACVGLLRNTSLHGDDPANFVWNAETVYNGTGNRVFTRDLSSGDWWARTDAALPEGAALLPIIFYADGTNVTGSGSQQAHPVMVTVGNFRWYIRQKSKGWRTVGLIPVINASRATKDTTVFKEFKMWLFHKCLEKILQPIKQAYADGGFYLTVCGEERLMIPVVAFYSQDSLEVR